MLKSLGLAVAFNIGLCVQGFACEGQTGKVIFEDTFADDSGGWDTLAPAPVIKPPEMLFPFTAKVDYMVSHVLGFHATDADYCVEFLLPQSESTDNRYRLSLDVLAPNYAQLIRASVFSDGSVSLTNKTDAKTSIFLFQEKNVPAFKGAADAINALRIIVKGGKVTLMLNGQKLKVIRVQVPDGTLGFGLYGDIDTGTDKAAPIRIKSFKVTAGD